VTVDVAENDSAVPKEEADENEAGDHDTESHR
jgi:hypothetical protein